MGWFAGEHSEQGRDLFLCLTKCRAVDTSRYVPMHVRRLRRAAPSKQQPPRQDASPASTRGAWGTRSRVPRPCTTSDPPPHASSSMAIKSCPALLLPWAAASRPVGAGSSFGRILKLCDRIYREPASLCFLVFSLRLVDPAHTISISLPSLLLPSSPPLRGRS